MAKKYLDQSGVQYLWNGIKSKFAAIGHSHTAANVGAVPIVEVTSYKGDLQTIGKTSLASVTEPGVYYIYQGNTYLSDYPADLTAEGKIYAVLEVFNTHIGDYISKRLTASNAASNQHSISYAFGADWRRLYDTDHKPTAIDVGAPGINRNVPDGADLNTYRTAGTWRTVGGTIANIPPGYTYGLLIVDRSIEGYIYQHYYVSFSGNVHKWTRFTESDVTAWTGWIKDYNESNKPTLSDLGAAAQTLLSNFINTESRSNLIDNLDTLVTNGIFNFPGSATVGAPSNEWCFVFNAVHSYSTAYMTQLVIPMTGGNMFYRIKTDNVWRAWIKIYSSNNITVASSAPANPQTNDLWIW